MALGVSYAPGLSHQSPFSGRGHTPPFASEQVKVSRHNPDLELTETPPKPQL